MSLLREGTRPAAWLVPLDSPIASWDGYLSVSSANQRVKLLRKFERKFRTDRWDSFLKERSAHSRFGIASGVSAMCKLASASVGALFCCSLSPSVSTPVGGRDGY